MNEELAPVQPRDPVTALRGVGPKRAGILAKLGIYTIEDLLRHYPRRYEDRRKPVQICALIDGEAALVRVYARRIVQPPAYLRGGAARLPLKIFCDDESGGMTLLFFNARWLASAFQTGTEYWVYGTPHRGLSGVWMAHPEFEMIVTSGAEGEDVNTGAGIVPVYPLTSGVSKKYIRDLELLAAPVAEKMAEILPESVLSERRLAPVGFAMKHIHFPKDEHALNSARYRLVYEELFLFQARLLYTRAHASIEGEGASTCDKNISTDYAASFFPFELTGAQRRAIAEIRMDMISTAPMHRLLQGDVGSGKTAVAAAAVLYAAKSGFQAAIMVPTEILATQHFQEFTRLFQETGVRVALLTAGLSTSQRRDVKAGLENGRINIVIGTHALIEPDIIFFRLGLVVTDEQHRFGVRQRLSLREKGMAPDTLVMTATPIPRTFALMLYADLDVSVLDETPPGRKIIETQFVDSSKRAAVYDFAECEIADGRQVYVVASLIGGDDDETAGMADGTDDESLEYFASLAMTDVKTTPAPQTVSPVVRSAKGLVEELSVLFSHRRVALLHGRMKGEQKEEVMRAFSAGEIDLLVSTVVIEVGVNVPNATLMIIENAERFGLAQLHQLRGRVGRGAAKSQCVLISDSKSEIALKRCETLEREHDGFRIARLDFSLRGPGDLFGVRQHGLPEFKIADPVKHMEILNQANSDAKLLLARDPKLNMPEHAVLKSIVEEYFVS